MYEHLVAGTDFSDTARHATDRANALAGKLESRLTLVHAGSDAGDRMKALASEYSAEAVVESGSPAEVLITKVQELGGDLLVVGSVGMRGARRFMLGNVPNKVSHHAETDLLIVRTDPPPTGGGDPYGKILVGTDGSPTAKAAVERAAGLAASLGAGLTVLCAYEPPSESEMAQMKASSGDVVAQWNTDRELRDVPEEFRWRIAGAAQAEDVLDRSKSHAAKHDVDAEVRAEEGNAAEVLISVAEREGFDLIVVGNVGMTGAKRLMLGNVPHRISHHAPTDLLILRTT